MLSGQRHYLGPYGSPESRERYARLLAEYEASGRHGPVHEQEIRITEALARYLSHAENYYGAREFVNMRPALRDLARLYGGDRASTFGAIGLRVLRQGMIDRGLSRIHAFRMGPPFVPVRVRGHPAW